MNKYHGNAKDRKKPFMNNLIVYHNIEVPSFKYLSWGCVHNHQDNSLKITKFQALWLWYLVSISNIDQCEILSTTNTPSLTKTNKNKEKILIQNIQDMLNDVHTRFQKNINTATLDWPSIYENPYIFQK